MRHATAVTSGEPSAVAVPAGPVLAWGLPRLRDLPWRHTRDAWLVLAAEVMLQQTQVDRVRPKWTEFCCSYPRPSTLAGASLGDLLRHWHGLGYPRRARDLHAAATLIAERHDDVVPGDLGALLALPGVGPYTARAVLAFAYEQDVGVVDTNIARVLARLSGSRLTPKVVQRIADAAVPAGDGWAWNQVLMDLGATLCRPTPDCTVCPLAGACRWHGTGHVLPDPAIGSAGVSTRQAPYEGSDRQARGLVMRRLLAGPVLADRFDATIVAGLVADGLVTRGDDGRIRLP